MSYTVAGVGLIRGTVHHPAQGTWAAEVEVNTEAPITGLVELALPGLTLVGTVVGGGVSEARQKLRLVGGQGGLRRVVAGQHFNRAVVRTIVNYLLGAAGETLAADSDAALLGKQLDHWQHVRGTAAQGLDLLTQHLGTSWYVDEAGAVHLGDHDWQTVEPDHVLVREDLVGHALTISSTEDTVRPGTSFRGVRVSAVEHTFDEQRARSLVRWGSTLHPEDEALRDVIRHLQEKTLPAYRAEVVTQNADGTVDLKPTSSKVGPGWKSVPIALQGLFQVRVQAGAGCILEFLDNDPTQPIVRQFLPGTVFAEAQMASGAEAARKGDGAGWLVVTPAPAAVGDAFIKTVAWSPTDPGVVAPPVIKIPLSITGGSAVVKKVA